ncbi:MAG: hypothetical protein ACETWT_06185 [Thermodesulfobacteriota bacterium]
MVGRVAKTRMPMKSYYALRYFLASGSNQSGVTAAYTCFVAMSMMA